MAAGIFAVGWIWQSAEPKPSGFAPIAFHTQKCARCHGDEGSGFPKEFGKGMEEEYLQRMIEDMLVAQKAGNLPEPHFDALAALHRAWILREPFVIITRIDAQKVTVEASSGAKLTARIGAASVKILPEKRVWTLELPPKSNLSQLVIQAERKGKTVKLEAKKSLFSQSAPLPERP